MADPTTVSGLDMYLWYSDTATSGDKKVVCIQDSNYNGTRNEITDETNCGVLSEVGPAKHQFTGTIVIDTVPDADEASYAQLQTLFINNTQKYWQLRNATDTVFHGAMGKISQLGQQNSASGGAAKATITVTLTGTLDTDSQS